jgi:hypothetical protein
MALETQTESVRTRKLIQSSFLRINANLFRIISAESNISSIIQMDGRKNEIFVAKLAALEHRAR